MRASSHMIRYSYLLVLLVCCASSISAQVSDYTLSQYTIADGLPSNECHKILQDSLGYIWIATDRGLVRYDGYEFKVYGIQDGLTDIGCLDILLDHNQDLWIWTYSNKVFKYERQHDYIFLYKYQSIIDPYLGVAKIIDFIIDETMDLHISLSGIGILTIQDHGQYALDRGEQPDSLAKFFTKPINGGIMIAFNNRGPAPFFEGLDLKLFSLNQFYKTQEYNLSHGLSKIKGVNSERKAILNLESFILSDSVDMVVIDGVRYIYTHDSIFIQTNMENIQDLKSHRELGLVTAELNPKGVTVYSSLSDFIDQKGRALLPNISATSISASENGDLWISTLDKGVFKFSKNAIRKQISFSDRNVTRIETAPSGVYYVLDDRTLMFRDANFAHQKILDSPLGKIFNLTYDGKYNQVLVSMRNSIVLSERNEVKQMILEFPYNKMQVEAVLKDAFCLDDGNYLLSSSSYFFVSRSLYGSQDYCSYPQEKFIQVKGAASISDGHYLLGTTTGLYEYDHTGLHKVRYSDSIVLYRPWEVDMRINDIQKMDPWYILATQGNGVEFRDLQGNKIHRTKSDGLVSDVIEKIFIDRHDHIYLCTKSGLSKLWFGEDDSLRIMNFTKLHGLPSNEIHDIAEWNDTLYIATGAGVVVLDEEVELNTRQQVLIEKILANKKEISTKVFELSHNVDNLSIQYRTIDHIMQGDIMYRYSLNENMPTHTTSTEANLSGLSPGEYTFKVQSMNMDSQWSDYTTVEFTIHPPWWLTAGFRLFLLGMMVGLGYYVYQRRTTYLQDKIDVEREVRDLEKAALQAQMNPHFIFNCLNSIQNFVMQNNKTEAMKYLGQFAKLIRQNLNASVESTVYVDQEITMLTDYLDLEKLRLNDRFDYEIDCDPNLPIDEIKIPSLLIQPFVENAVIHGMRDKVAGGEIKISFEQQADLLQVTVVDNGQASREIKKDEVHKSVGMSITQKRLAFLNQVHTDDYKVTPQYTSAGTTVEIQIKYFR